MSEQEQPGAADAKPEGSASGAEPGSAAPGSAEGAGETEAGGAQGRAGAQAAPGQEIQATGPGTAPGSESQAASLGQDTRGQGPGDSKGPSEVAPPVFESDPLDSGLTDDERTDEEISQRKLRADGLERLGLGSVAATDEYSAADTGRPSVAATGRQSAAAGHDVNQYFAPTEMAPPPGPLQADQIARLRRMHVRCDSYYELVELLPRRRVVLLSGKQGTGRRYTALAGVDACTRSAGGSNDAEVRVELTDPLTDLSAIDPATLTRGHGYVCDATDQRKVPTALVASLSKRCRDAGVLLVLLVVEGSAPRDDISTDYVVSHVPPPLEEIVRSHVACELGVVLAGLVMSDQSVIDQIDRLSHPGEASEFARYIIIRAPGQDDLQAVLEEWRPWKMIGKVKEELEVGDRWQRAVLLACAVLEKLPAGTVVRAAQSLAGLMAKAEGSTGDDGPAGFAEPIAQWSKCVRTSGMESGGPNGKGLTVHLGHERLGQFLLEAAWQEHLGMRDPILTWLRSLAGHGQVAVRIRAAQAAAKLATYDFDVVRAEVIEAWVRSGRFAGRQCAAWAIEGLVQKDRFAGRVRRLVRKWAASAQVSSCAAAIAVFGTYYGARYPGEAVEGMRRIAASRIFGEAGRDEDLERGLARAIAQSATEMFVAGAGRDVITMLAQWARSDSWLLRWAASRGLVRLARQRGSREGWPALLILYDDRLELRTAIVTLWRNALVQGAATENAWVSLWQWLEADERVSESDVEHIRGHLRALVKELASDDRILRPLRFHVRLWEFRRRRQIPAVPDDLRRY